MRPASEAVARQACAKINLALHVTGRRADGYHLLDTLAVFTGLGEGMGDALRFVSADELSLHVTGRFGAEIPRGPDNLVLRAARALAERCPDRPIRGADIFLDKELPAGAGIGGGSCDAAATLLALNDLWHCRLDMKSLVEIGAGLGADVPMGLFASALRARGIGEEISLLPFLPALPVVLVWPGRPVSTAKVFAALCRHDGDPVPPVPERLADPAAVTAYLGATRNDLQDAAIATEPAIEQALQALAQTPALMVRMSGSGSTCFGIYDDAQTAETAAEALAEAHPEWWVRAALAG
ncbi:4-(cytidine 5'-diphospho)-2-C-methyl-D-erythritol kinase [Afifella pfennigii]|uniref:4-(cytidine 5'-diphospho)-2-C-methyl-D-erythritol kinase n=1 Tax=Afifella pfennigii TaxID=209897 RepID=UPI00047C8CA1|nr:4-(cytidine 5'-diphospho)-2-C-methyl-D-erythritol kinase [Afifella pfennigii]